ncbi:MAG: hypothetical protein BM557_05355 [Flavobacterium sp. MedPE-SWcel]|nr:MAG: hypothetical protein BM557_05355 [Flavobacterium sp. MedPE-SWcel]
MISFQSCGTYNSKTSDIENDLFNGNFDKAVVGVEQNRFLKKKRNKLLYLMEKGKIEHLRGNYTESNKLLEEAYILIDDLIKTSVGQAVAAKFTNPMAEPYKGEDFEKVTIYYYKALNYFMLGRPDEALVEAKRINIKLYELNEKYKENKNRYSEDAFSQILQGVIYESVGDINNAFIAYRNAGEIYSKNGGQFFGVSMPEQLKKDLLRTAKRIGFTQEYNDYLKKFNIPPENTTKKTTASEYQSKPKGEAIIFWENGMGPAKDQIVITASAGSGIFYGSYMDGDILEEIIIPVPPGANIGSINAIAIPKYRERGSYYSKAEILVNGKPQELNLAQDFYPIAKQCLKDRMLRETIDLIVRFATKKATSAGLGALGKELLGDTGGDLIQLGADIAGAATEKADTRNWQTLPATISYTRVPLKEGENKFILRKYGPQGVDIDTIYIPYKRGLQIVNYFDIGRTQVIPVTPNKVKPVTKKSTPTLTRNGYTRSELSPRFINPNSSKTGVNSKILSKYNKWIDTGIGIVYKVTYEVNNKSEKKSYTKKVIFRSKNNKPVNVTFALSEIPFDSDLTEISKEQYYNIKSLEDKKRMYFKLNQELSPNKETTSIPITQGTPDFYVTIFKVE